MRHLDDPAAEAAVLHRRLTFLQEPTSFFYERGRPLSAEDFDDPYRQGMLTIAKATSQAELAWLRKTLRQLEKSDSRAQHASETGATRGTTTQRGRGAASTG
ncbi:hypothetical protein [Amycolatopsis rhizosphaerae]|uniref:hypothetical protein n=1 Tax=Amycolatopsis rhizosphaerae TaxID=2053003 RepID=UPI001C98D583|nr:hypothetical protein [Amycolatopsis rhizosphaerae]